MIVLACLKLNLFENRFVWNCLKLFNLNNFRLNLTLYLFEETKLWLDICFIKIVSKCLTISYLAKIALVFVCQLFPSQNRTCILIELVDKLPMLICFCCKKNILIWFSAEPERFTLTKTESDNDTDTKMSSHYLKIIT